MDGWYGIGGETNYDMEYIRTLTEDYAVNYSGFIYSEIRDTPQTDTLLVSLAQTSNGTVQLNSITPNTEAGQWTGVYFENTSIILQAHPEPGHQLTDWVINGEPAGAEKEISLTLDSGPVEVAAAFAAAENDDIVINEINYNSSEEWDTGDWIELFNNSEVDIDLSGWIFKDDDEEHAFVIPDGVIITSLGYLVLSDDTAAFKSIHPDAPMVDGERQAAGQHQVQFDAGNLSSGVYIFHLKAGNFSETKKMNSLK